MVLEAILSGIKLYVTDNLLEPFSAVSATLLKPIFIMICRSCYCYVSKAHAWYDCIEPGGFVRFSGSDQ